MSNSTLLFRLYLIIVFLILSFFSIVLSKDLFVLVLRRIQIITSLRMFRRKVAEEPYITLSNFYLERKNFFLVISLSELVLDSSSSFVNKDILYSLLAYAYYRSGLFNISEYYYLKALRISPNSCDIMFALGKMYLEMGYTSEVSALCNSIKTIDPDYDLSFLLSP